MNKSQISCEKFGDFGIFSVPLSPISQERSGIIIRNSYYEKI